jgi:hypothetical protein
MKSTFIYTIKRVRGVWAAEFGWFGRCFTQPKHLAKNRLNHMLYHSTSWTHMDAALLKDPNVMLLPHCGTMTIEMSRAMELYTIANIKSAVESCKVSSLVPEQHGRG